MPREQGAAAVEVLMGEIADPGTERTTLRIPSRLIVRTSTAAPAALAAAPT